MHSVYKNEHYITKIQIDKFFKFGKECAILAVTRIGFYNTAIAKFRDQSAHCFLVCNLENLPKIFGLENIIIRKSNANFAKIFG